MAGGVSVGARPAPAFRSAPAIAARPAFTPPKTVYVSPPITSPQNPLWWPVIMHPAMLHQDMPVQPSQPSETAEAGALLGAVVMVVAIIIMGKALFYD